jgi:regulator of protease activity HflC (stomatin/prohibitin superfamily)
MEASLVSIYDRPPPSLTRYAWWRFVEHHLPVLVIYLLVATLVGVVLAPFMLVTVPSGYVGVLWKRFGGGTVLDPHKLKAEGMRITLPWNTVFLYDLRLQSATETYNAISRDGISLTATINIRFRLKREAVPQLHQSVGPDYIQSLIEPEIGNRMREVIAEYTAEDVYSTKRAEVQDKIRQRAESMLSEKMVTGGESEDQEENAPYRIPLNAMLNLIDTLILGIELPTAVETAINRKIEQYYISEEYKFRVAREIRESERKKIEAEGISEFQQIVSQGISPSYLRWRGIEATLQLAQSSNSKIVIVGNSKDGLPIILGNVDTSPSPRPASPAGNGDAAPKERTTAVTPSPPLEKTPTASQQKLPATPLEKTPADTLSKPVEKTPSTQSPEAQHSYSFPTSLSDIKAMLSPLTGTAPLASDGGKPDSGVSTKPAAAQ